ncbi:hypothetical protein [Mesorhizobium sp. M1252]|uniref:hypothetical protein n=1 Tax=Mesorhizobium sp. M1252 TaxID=2957073 RepID=UPI00333B0BA8
MKRKQRCASALNTLHMDFISATTISAGSVWMSRHDSVADRRSVRNEFTATKILAHLESAAPKIASVFSHLYENAIDFGAHPNERGFSMSTSVEHAQDRVHLNTIYLHADSLSFDLGIKTAARVGLCALMISRLIYPLRSSSFSASMTRSTS